MIVSDKKGTPIGDLKETEFDVVEDFTGQVMKQSDAKYYHTYQDGVCYEFALGLGTSGAGIDDQITPVDRNAVFSKLERILASVKISGMSEDAKAALAQPAEPVKPTEAKATDQPSAAVEQSAKASDQTLKSDETPKK